MATNEDVTYCIVRDCGTQTPFIEAYCKYHKKQRSEDMSRCRWRYEDDSMCEEKAEGIGTTDVAILCSKHNEELASKGADSATVLEMGQPAEPFPLTPLFERVIVLRTEAEEQTESGIIIPDSSKEKPCEGVIIAAGAGKLREDGTLRRLAVKPGDKILFSRYADMKIEVAGKEYQVMNEEDIIGIVDKDVKSNISPKEPYKVRDRG